jgi:hypothetical protein
MAEGKCFNYGPVGFMRACWAVKCQVNFWPTQKPPSYLEGFGCLTVSFIECLLYFPTLNLVAADMT